MKKTLAALMLLVAALPVQAPLGKSWTYQQLFNQAELVAIGKPLVTQETEESVVLPDFSPNVNVIGLSTDFDISLVMKGDKGVKKALLHHYRLVYPLTEDLRMIPSLVSFDPQQPTRYLLFLRREADGRYAPVSGHAHASFSAPKLQGAH